MSFNLSIESDNSIRLGPGVVESVCFVTCPPDDFNNEDVTFTLEIIGKILTDENNVYTNAIRELAMWSLIPPIKAGCYRKVTLETIIGGKIARKVFFPSGFVVDYREYFTSRGYGRFNIYIKQKQGKNEQVVVEGECIADDDQSF